MDIHLLVQPEVQAYIKAHSQDNLVDLAFKKSPFPTIPMLDLLTQIESKQKSKHKLSKWYNTDGIVFPPKLSIEQTSSEECAAYKASLVEGDTLIDLTGGFGIDCYYFAQRIKQVTHCEIQPELSAVVQHNYQQLQQANITCIAGDSLDYLTENNQSFDYIYLDPARRNQNKEKVFFLSDCTPNIVTHLDMLLTHTTTVLVKTSPLLDLQAGLSELKYVKAIHLVALQNEVKELLWIIEKNYIGSLTLTAVNLTKTEPQITSFSWSDDSEATYAEPQTYLYEPNSALLKTGKFNAISAYFKVNKLHQHSQLYTSENLMDFSGRRFKIKQHLPYNKATAKEYLQQQKANITVRNFPIKVDELRKKWKIKDGGDSYIFFTTTLSNQKVFLICEPV
ncbi:class I SAM-dependent methyltransferase [Myroides sp. 1354]|uniref:class I SAM-dependent methyltransferase n=1 Tax=unclassified Myroides TaxID=2642485 RepID=UPI002578337F|nr:MULTISPECIES: class I SAM-dependent methyltransferase [unclassified Myroides]MDM1045769.1 class I SAM-dependent methyltransferase [Myroides sp. R163-1]MDM1055776.1 class I SAM-dependent methyltransferase [Myroides sp. 1354]MDM1069868.1 class I SAM-dependent methyltransferase [Myroides sp. 1372]